nr:hypothetical protein [uncultured Bacteroides sp.]
MEPVELTIITRNQTKEGLEEIMRDTSKVGKTVEQVTADFKARMMEQSEVVKQVEADIKSLEKQLEKAAPGKAKMELTAELNEAKKVLAEEKGELASLEKQVDRSAEKHTMLRTEIRNLKEQMAGMTEGTQEYAAAMQRLGEMQDRQGDINTQGKIFSDDNKNIKATMDAVSGLTGAMTAGVGAASLFGVEEEKLAQIQTRLQAVMAITMGVQQVANTLNKDSYFTHVLLTGAKNMLTAATTRLSVALGISNVAAKALMATLTMGLSVVITGLIVLWDRYSDRTREAQRAITTEIDKTRSSLQQVSDDVDFDTRIAEASGKSKKELIELRKEAAKTALALADASFDKVNAKFMQGEASREQLEAARELSKKAWDDYNKTMQDAVVYDYEERTDKQKKNVGPGNDAATKANEIAEAEFKARQKINDMTIALMEEGEKKEKELALKKFDDELERIDHEERERMKALKAAQKKGLKVTPDQVATVKDQAMQQRNLAGEQYMKDFFAVTKDYADKNKKLKEEEEQSWIDYNKEYGTYQEKRAAITKDYENKIAKSKTGGDKATQKKKMEEELKNLDLENLKAGIDWTSVFGNLDKVSTEALGRLKKQLQSFIKEQKNLSPENIKEIVGAINSIDLEEKSRSPFQAISDSFGTLAKANKELTEARDEYNKVLEKGTEQEKKDAEAKLDSAEAAKRKAQAEATDSLHAGVDKMREYTQAAEGVLGIMNELGIKTPEWLSGTMEGMNEMLDGLAQIDVTKPMTILTGGLQTIKGAVKSIVSLGGTIKLFNGADYSEYNEMVKRYEVLLDVWDRLLDKKKAYIKESYGAEAAKAGQEALDIIDKSQEAHRNMARARASSGASAGSHSIAYRQNKGLGGYAPELYNYVSRNGNYNDITSALLGASEEQLKKVREQMPEMWAGLDGDFREHLENIISGAEQAKEVLAMMKEQITGISFDSFKDSYLGMLSDLSLKNADFAKDFEKKLQESIMRSMLEKNYSTRIKALYDSWAEAGNDGTYTTGEVERLRNMQQELTDAMLAERDKMAAAFGWSADDSTTSSQSGRSGAVTTITEETAGKIEGIATSVQIHVASMDEKLTDLSQYAYEAIGLLNTIAENTAFCKRLDDIADAMEKMERDGVKMR